MASSPLANSARGPRRATGVSMTMERARLALKSFARLLSNSNIGSENLKIQNMCQLQSLYTTPTVIRALILHLHLSGLLKAHTFQCPILLFLPVRDGNLLISHQLIVYRFVVATTRVMVSHTGKLFPSSFLTLTYFARSACLLLHRHPSFLRLSSVIIERAFNHQWSLHKYCIFFLFSEVY